MDLVGTTYIPSRKTSNEANQTKSVLLSKTPKWCFESTTLCDVSTKNIVLFTSAYPLHLHKDCGKTDSGRSGGLPGQHGIGSANGGSTTNQTFGSLRGGLESKGGSNFTDDSYYVFVADLNTPWDIVLVTSRPTEVTALSWDLISSEEFVIADSEGYIETWHMNNSVITDWNRVARLHFPEEHFLKAKFIQDSRRIYVNLDKQDSIYFKEKFLFRNAPEISQAFSEEDTAACLLISSTGLAVLVAYSSDFDPTSMQDPIHHNQTNINDSSLGIFSTAQKLGPIRGRVRHVDISFNKEGQLLVATSNGDPRCPVRFYSLLPRLDDDMGYSESFSGGDGEIQNKTLSLDVHAYPGIFIKSASSDQVFESETNSKGINSALTQGLSGANEEEVSSEADGKNASTPRNTNNENFDVCQAVIDLCFVECDDNAFSILVATQHASGGRVELWELKEAQLTTHKIFLPPEGLTQSCPRNIVPVWQYQEVFVAGSSSAQVVKISTPHSAFQTGRASACYVTIAYTDGSIQCLLRDSLHQIGCVDIPKSGNPQSSLLNDAYPSIGPSSAKISRLSSVAICDAAFSANANVLVVIDSLGQLYFYRMSPISDPGGPHTPDSIVLMLTKCLLSGFDWWDINVCCAAVSLAGNKDVQGQTSNPASLSAIEVICEKLTEDFNKQPPAIQNYYLNRWMAIKASVYRLSASGWGSSHHSNRNEHKAADTFMQSMLISIHGAFKSLLRPGTLIDLTSNDTAFDKVSKILTAKMKDEINVDRLATLLASKKNEFSVDPNILQSFHHLIQWTTDLALNICARVPEFKGPAGTSGGLSGPGASLLSNPNVLNMLRELILLIRLWGQSVPASRPVYTKTSADESFDVLPKLFHIITKLITQPDNLEESLLDEAALLPCHIMIPPLHHSLVCARGMAPALNSGHEKCPISYEFGSEPQQDTFLLENTHGGGANGGYGGLGISPLVWSNTSGAIDCVKHMFLGRWPFSVKRCTRYVEIRRNKKLTLMFIIC